MSFKKVLMIVSAALTLSFFGCGGGSQEAKELLQRILNLVGIPQEIVLTVCQDENRDGICNALELQAKVVIDRGESLDTILQKITNTEEGKYLLETYDPTLPLLLVLRNNGSEYYTAEYTVPFNGLEPQQEEKDLSLLQAMVDAGYLSSEEISAVSEMNNQEQFYETLLRDFEYNLNTLTQNDLSTPRSVLANLSELADELQDAGIADTLPQQINDCNGSESCVDDVLAPVSEELKIDENESAMIKEQETQTTKETFAGKTLYSYYVDNGSEIVAEINVNDQADGWTYQELVGGERSGSVTIVIEGDKITLYNGEENPEAQTVAVYETYIAIGEKKFYYNREDAEAEVSSEPTPTPTATQEENATNTEEPTPTPTPTSGEEVVYGQWVKPSQSVCESNGGRYDTYSAGLDNGTKYEGTTYTECDANWENAHTICSATGGVLPNIETLRAVVTDCGGVLGKYANNQNNESYQECYREKGFAPYHYWSSTTPESDSSFAWSVNFYNYDTLRSKELSSYIRCVR